jgi:predicted dinucleotide-binding enzyme
VLFRSGPDSLADAVKELGERASAAKVSQTVERADVVVEAIPFGALDSLAGLPWEGKVLLSASNYYADRDGSIDLDGRTQAEYTASVVEGARVAKIFNTIYFEHLRTQGDPDRSLAKRRVLPFVADDSQAARAATELALELGFGPLFLGGLEATRGLAEPGDKLYNKEITLAQASREVPADGRVLVVGASGTLGAAVRTELEEQGYEVVGASRSGEYQFDMTKPESVSDLFDHLGAVDHVVVTAGLAAFKPLREMEASVMQESASNKFLGQLHVAKEALQRISTGGSVVLTSGQLAQHPMPGSSMVSAVNAAIEAVARAAALEDLDGRFLHVVSPGWIKETMEAMGMDPSPGTAASEMAEVYVATLRLPISGQIFH